MCIKTTVHIQYGFNTVWVQFECSLSAFLIQFTSHIVDSISIYSVLAIALYKQDSNCMQTAFKT